MDIVLVPEVRQYLLALTDVAEKARISRYLDRQREMGYVLREPISKSIGDGIHEIRPGQHRFLFFVDRSRIVVAHAFRKKTQKTPRGEIMVALKKREEWLRREQSL